MVDKKDLTTDDRIAAAVQRSMPRERPRLTTEMEVKLADTEHRAAAQYASMEEMTRRLHETADAIDQGEIELSVDDLEEVDDATPEPIDFEDSLVQNIEIVRAQLNKDPQK